MNIFPNIYRFTALEIFLMIKIGDEIGALNTISLIFLTAIIGIYYARIRAYRTLRSGILSLYQNKAPINELISGASIAFAALLSYQALLQIYLVSITNSSYRNTILKLAIRKKTVIRESNKRK